MYKNRVGRMFRKFGKRAYRKVVKPYVNKKKGYSNRMKLYREVNAIKKMINAEKKNKEFTQSGIGVAQLYNGSDGAVCISITPTITQGNGFDQRNGRSIKLSGMYLRALVQQQTNTSNRISFNITIVRCVGKTQTPTEVIIGMFNPDPITTVRQYNCPRNPDSFTDYRILASRNFFLEADYLGTQTAQCNVYMPLKLNHHLRYSNNTNTIEEGEIYLIVRADRGDAGTALTGGFMQVSANLSYYDN